MFCYLLHTKFVLVISDLSHNLFKSRVRCRLWILIFPEWGLLFLKKEKHYCLYFILQIHHDGWFQVDCYCELNTTVLFSKLLFQLKSSVKFVFSSCSICVEMIIYLIFCPFLSWLTLKWKVWLSADNDIYSWYYRKCHYVSDRSQSSLTVSWLPHQPFVQMNNLIKPP